MWGQLVPALCGLLLLGFWGLIYLDSRRTRRMRRLQTEIKQVYRPLWTTFSWGLWGGKYRMTQVNGQQTRWRPFLLAITQDEVLLFSPKGNLTDGLHFALEGLRWFGRPEKYSRPGLNEIWLHFEQRKGWQKLQIKLYYADMRRLVSNLKLVSSAELITAYRRRRPYIHAGPVTARPAVEDIHGAWTLYGPISLYLTPMNLVILNGTRVERVLALADMQAVAALRRLDEPQADGLVRFRIDDELLAYSLPEYESFAEQLAQAAKRSLETPLERKRKQKDDDEDDEDW